MHNFVSNCHCASISFICMCVSAWVQFYSLSVMLPYIDCFCQGPVGAAGLYSPEAQIANSPLIIGYLNGMVSLVDRGLTR